MSFLNDVSFQSFIPRNRSRRQGVTVVPRHHTMVLQAHGNADRGCTGLQNEPSGRHENKLIPLMNGMVLAVRTDYIHSAAGEFWFWTEPWQKRIKSRQCGRQYFCICKSLVAIRTLQCPTRHHTLRFESARNLSGSRQFDTATSTKPQVESMCLTEGGELK